MPLIRGMKSTNVWKAFLLTSVASTLVIFIAMNVNTRFDTYSDKNNQEVTRTTNYKSIGLTLLATFLSSMIAYTLMYFVFGYGGAMLVDAD